jgi:hypothetical protein
LDGPIILTRAITTYFDSFALPLVSIFIDFIRIDEKVLKMFWHIKLDWQTEMWWYRGMILNDFHSHPLSPTPERL